MPDFIPLYELMVGPKPAWPVNREGGKTGVNVVRKSSGLLVMQIPIDQYSPRGTAEALKLARYFIKTHNMALTKHRQQQARDRSVRLKLIKEKHHVNAA